MRLCLVVCSVGDRYLRTLKYRTYTRIEASSTTKKTISTVPGTGTLLYHGRTRVLVQGTHAGTGKTDRSEFVVWQLQVFFSGRNGTKVVLESG